MAGFRRSVELVENQILQITFIDISDIQCDLVHHNLAVETDCPDMLELTTSTRVAHLNYLFEEQSARSHDCLKLQKWYCVAL